jgi:uncharacterized protein YdhG (YjbR/CyaY superfamily)
MESRKFKTVDAYFSHVPPERYAVVDELRKIIKVALPEAEEVISYNMPAYKHKGILVYFGLYAQHIGFYPTPSAIEAFKDRLVGFTFAKGSIQFPLDEELPIGLIQDICRFRMKEVKKK